MTRNATKGTFLCGCRPEEKRNYTGDVVPSLIPNADPVYVDKRYDNEGYEVCPEHGDRMYGWISDDSMRPNYIESGDGRPPSFWVPKMKSRPLTSREEDKRDNRDPEEIGVALQAHRRSAGNGHSMISGLFQEKK